MQSPSGLGLLGAIDIFAPLPPTRWLCPELYLAPGAPTMLAGYGYSGKTIIAQTLALSVASGRPLWGRYRVMSGPVVHLDYEQGKILSSRRYQRIARAMGIEPESLSGRLEFAPLPTVYLTGSGGELDLLCRLGEDRAMVLVDSWRAAHPKVDENSSEVRTTLDRMATASERTGCVFVILHHARKPQEGSVAGKYEIRGSSGFFDGCQTIYVLDGSEVSRPVCHLLKERVSGAKMAPFRLLIEDEDSGASLSVRVDSEGVQEPARNLCVEALELVLHFPGMSTEAIRRDLKCRKASLVAALQSLTAAGNIQRIADTGVWIPKMMNGASSAVPTVPDDGTSGERLKIRNPRTGTG